MLLFVDLDREIRRKTEDRSDLDDVTQRMMEVGKVSTSDLRAIAERVAGGKLDTLDTPILK